MNKSVDTLRSIALSFSAPKVAAMVTKIKKSFERRDIFEASQGLCIVAKSSYTVERQRMLSNVNAVAMLFLALDVQPVDVIERKVASNAMFNAKALKKVTEIARFVAGIGERLERVARAFIACAIIATDRGVDTITNATNRKFLCGADFSGQVTDADLIAHLAELRARHMTSGAETQSSQMRNVLDVLGLGSVLSVDKPRDAIVIDATHGFYTMFRETFMKPKA